MATKKSTKKKDDGVPAAGIAAGVVAAAAAAGAAYYFYGSKRAPQHRKAAVKWAHDMKRDVVREAKKLKKLDDTVIHGIIDTVAGTYKGAGITADDLKAVVAELKQNVRKVKAEVRGKAGTAKKAVKKTVKKAAKKKTAKRRA